MNSETHLSKKPNEGTRNATLSNNMNLGPSILQLETDRHCVISLPTIYFPNTA